MNRALFNSILLVSSLAVCTSVESSDACLNFEPSPYCTAQGNECFAFAIGNRNMRDLLCVTFPMPEFVREQCLSYSAETHSEDLDFCFDELIDCYIEEQC
jgi:hypothetical protein